MSSMLKSRDSSSPKSNISFSTSASGLLISPVFFKLSILLPKLVLTDLIASKVSAPIPISAILLSLFWLDAISVKVFFIFVTNSLFWSFAISYTAGSLFLRDLLIPKAILFPKPFPRLPAVLIY